eukprot:1911256-Alexandrium_andersonii.AAC.1
MTCSLAAHRCARCGLKAVTLIVAKHMLCVPTPRLSHPVLGVPGPGTLAWPTHAEAISQPCHRWM